MSRRSYPSPDGRDAVRQSHGQVAEALAAPRGGRPAGSSPAMELAEITPNPWDETLAWCEANIPEAVRMLMAQRSPDLAALVSWAFEAGRWCGQRNPSIRPRGNPPKVRNDG